MNKTLLSFFCIQILFTEYCINCKVYAEDLTKQEVKLNTLIEELYSMYNDALENEKTYITRRFFTVDGHSYYTLNVKKLKEVGGVKTHNLRLEGKSKREDPIIYINNPVEAQIPNPFISIDQFKKAMVERIQKQKREFDVNRNIIINANKQYKVFKHLENLSTEIFDVKKHVKHVVDVSNNTKLTIKKSTVKLMKPHIVNKKRAHKVHISRSTKSIPLLHNGRNTVNKKRKQKIHTRSTTQSTNLSDKLIETAPHIANKKIAHKVHVSRGTKSTRIPHIMNTTTLPKTIPHEEMNTETIVAKETITATSVHEEVTIEITSEEKNTTQKTLGREINAETIADKEKTTETPVIEKVTAETASNEKNTTEKSLGHEITAETIVHEETTTETPVDKEVNTETVSDAKNTTQTLDYETTEEIIAKGEIITEPIIPITQPTVGTTRTRQLRPFVFMGDR